MNPQTVYALCFFLAVGFASVKADEYNSYESESTYNSNEEQYEDETPEKELSTSNDDSSHISEKSKTIVEDYNSETSALEEQELEDPKSYKGLCQWGIGRWYKVGYQTKCNCLKCTCIKGAKWDCVFNFASCPYFYCGNTIYNPNKQICCCGKTHDKRASWSCCGYYYYNTRVSKCCNYYSVKTKKANCPRYQL